MSGIHQAARLAQITGIFSLLALGPMAFAGHDDDDERADRGMYCTASAIAVHKACQFEAFDDYFKSSTACINTPDDSERASCYADLKTARREFLQACNSKLAGRRSICATIGEQRFDPPFNEQVFESNYRSPTSVNRYFPLKVGYKWEFKGAGEVVRQEILDQTKLIDDVRCVVLRDIVTKTGGVAEATDDWYAQSRSGNTWYCGEEVKDYESFDGDQPKEPELVDISGSFKAGRNGDKPGIIFLGAPRVGVMYREEYSVANAEDLSQVLSIDYSYGRNPSLDRSVPPLLARLLCANDCIVLKAINSNDPGVVAFKYYAPGIGNFLEVNAAGEAVQLVKCNMDSRCASLPQP
jgi:hypothetical protein